MCDYAHLIYHLRHLLKKDERFSNECVGVRESLHPSSLYPSSQVVPKKDEYFKRLKGSQLVDLIDEEDVEVSNE